MMTIRSLVPCLLWAGLAVPGGAQTFTVPKAEVQHEADVNFASFKTYAWKPSQEPLPDPVRQTQMTAAIEGEMRGKKLTKVAAGDADLLVRFYASVHRSVRGAGRQSEGPYGDLRTSVDVEKMAEGTLIIELYTAAAEHLVWRGTLTRVLRESSFDEASVRSAVKTILRSYPPVPRPEAKP